MKKNILLILLVIVSLVFYTCGEKKSEVHTPGEDATNSPEKHAEIRKYNQAVRESQAENRSPCDTLSLISYIIANYPAGSYLLKFDKTIAYSIQKYAVIYLNQGDGNYVLAVIVRSKPGERPIELKNIIGFAQSYIDFDSTKLGTAFFCLTLFKCNNGMFNKIWEFPVPDDGGFNDMSLEKWAYNGTPYIKINFHYAPGVGHIDYNYFLLNGLTQPPHLLMTYKGIDYQRTLANVNNDNYPDYYEYLYFNYADRVVVRDSIPFVWSIKDSVYVNTRNRRQTRPY